MTSSVQAELKRDCHLGENSSSSNFKIQKYMFEERFQRNILYMKARGNLEFNISQWVSLGIVFLWHINRCHIKREFGEIFLVQYTQKRIFKTT